MNFVIAHDEYGVFLGCSRHFAFWSNLNPAGQICACTFATGDDAHQFLNKLVAQEDIPACTIVWVNCEGPYADIAILKKAGLGHLLGDMEQQVLLYAEPMGSA